MNDGIRIWLNHRKKPALNVYLAGLRRRIYTKIADLSAEVFKSKEPVPFKEINNLKFAPAKIGDPWGGKFDCAWFKFEGEIPPEFLGERLAVVIDIQGEGCLYNSAGAVQGTTNVLMACDNYVPFKGKKVVFLDRIGSFADGKVSFLADCGNNKPETSSGQSHLLRAEIAVFHPDIHELYYDFMAAYQYYYSKVSAEEKKLAQNLIKQAKKAAGGLTPEEVQNAREIFKPLFAEEDKKDFFVTSIGHGHLDLAWLWPVRETRRKAIRTVANQIANAERYPGYVFGISQPQQLAWLKEDSPELYEKVKKHVKSGGLECQGGMWVEPDTNIPSGESLIRQCYYGQKFWREEFGLTAKYLWLPDVFGYSAALPQIVKKCGMDAFMTIKLSWNNINKFPHHTFNWRGLSNDEILAHMPPEGDYCSSGEPYVYSALREKYREKDVSNLSLVPFGVGDGGAGPGEYHIEMTKRSALLNGLPEVKFGSAQSFFDELHKDTEKYPNHKGELYLEKHQGTYTTQSANKKYNKTAENLLHEVEWLATCAHLAAGQNYPHEFLERIWKEVLLYQFHDILPGSSIERVYTESKARYKILIAELQEKRSEILKSLSQNGKECKFLINSSPFENCGVPAYGVSEIKAETENENLAATENTLENEKIKAVFDAQGQITSLEIKGQKNNFIKTVANSVRIYRDKKLNPFNAWDIDINYTKKAPELPKLLSVSCEVKGNFAVRVQEYAFNKSTIKQTITLAADGDFVSVKNEVDWHETNKMLRIDSYPAAQTETALFDIQFGHIERGTKTETSVDYAEFEVCAHKWADVFDGKTGFAVLSDCKYGWRVKNGLMSLNCLRSTVHPDKTADRGKHEFDIAFYPHTEAPEKSNLFKNGYNLSMPPRAECGKLPQIPQIISSKSKNIIVETICMTEDGKLSARVYNKSSEEASAELAAGIKFDKIYESDMLFENKKELANLDLRFAPFEVKTLLFSLPPASL